MAAAANNSGRPLVPKPPPLPLATLTQLLNLPNVSYVPLGTLLATTRSEGDALFTRQIGSKTSVAAAKAAETARKKKKEEEAQQQQQQLSRAGSRRGSASSRRGSATRLRGEDNNSDAFSIPEYVKNPYAPLFIGKKAAADDAGAKRRKSRRKSDMRRRSSAAWVMPTAAELEDDAMPRPLQPSMFSRDAKLASLEREKELAAQKIVDGRECAIKSVTTYGSPKSLRSESIKCSLLDPAVCASPKTTPRHITHVLEKLQHLAASAEGGHQQEAKINAETIDWTTDAAGGGSGPLPRTAGDGNGGDAKARDAISSSGSSTKNRLKPITTFPSGALVATAAGAGGAKSMGPELSRSLVPLNLPSPPRGASTVLDVDASGGDIRSFLPRPLRVPQVLSKVLEKQQHAQDGSASAPPIRTVEMLQHRDGTISVKPNPPRYLHL